MGLNKQAGNMYPDISHTWNPLIGECPHKCSYCSTNKLRERYPEMENRYSGELRLSEKHFEDNFGGGKTIFVCAQNDLFARAVPEKFITRIFDHCKKYPNNKYYFQSKNPIRMVKYVFDFPPETVILTTIETNREIYIGHYSGGLRAKNRAIAMAFFHNAIITIEPIMQFDLNQFVKLIVISGAKKVYIGADSSNNNLPEPSKEDVENLIEALKALGIDVLSKKNLGRLL